MKYLFLILSLFIQTLFADTVGVDMKPWTLATNDIGVNEYSSASVSDEIVASENQVEQSSLSNVQDNQVITIAELAKRNDELAQKENQFEKNSLSNVQEAQEVSSEKIVQSTEELTQNENQVEQSSLSNVQDSQIVSSEAIVSSSNELVQKENEVVVSDEIVHSSNELTENENQVEVNSLSNVQEAQVVSSEKVVQSSDEPTENENQVLATNEIVQSSSDLNQKNELIFSEAIEESSQVVQKSQSSTTLDPSIVQKVLEETKRQKQKQVHTDDMEYSYPSQELKKKSHSIGDLITNDEEDIKSINLKEERDSFFSPIVEFMKSYPWQFASLLLLSGLFITFFIILPFIRSTQQDMQNDEIDISEHIVKKVDSKPEGKVLDFAQFSELRGRLNESYIFKKEEILLSSKMSQDEKDRALMMHEWKFNQIQNYALPKLDTSDGARFKEGVNDLLSEKESREIVRSFLIDLIHNDTLDEKRREFLRNSLS